MSDDFLFDDIVLDADALAILDAEESKYFSTIANAQQNSRPSPQPTPRPAKRRRTDNDGGWNHSTPSIGGGGGKLVPQNQKRSDSFYDDLPNISLAGDGVYGVYSQSSNIPSSSAKIVKNPLGQRHQAAGSHQTVPAPVPVPAPAPLPRQRSSNLNQNKPPPRPPQQRTHTPPSNAPHNPTNVNRPQPQYQHRQQPSHPQQSHLNQARGSIPRAGPDLPQSNRPQNLGTGNVNVPRQQPVQQQARHVSPAPSQSRFPNVSSDSAMNKDLHGEIARLKAQLEQVRAWRHHLSSGSLILPFCDCVQMNAQQDSMQKALREEQDARFQNQGEVSILRKRMEKVCIKTQSHAEIP